ERQFGPPSRGGAVGRLGVIIGIAAGAVISLTLDLVLAANTGSASAEALAVSQREAIATSIATTRQFADSRLSIARANYDSIRRAFAAGQTTKAALDAARSERGCTKGGRQHGSECRARGSRCEERECAATKLLSVASQGRAGAKCTVRARLRRRHSNG